uniref:Uncharacterized protein n=1 Tax=Plectus sambesii TaxID=2011161 RepID=A0A914WXT8_9BILA
MDSLVVIILLFLTCYTLQSEAQNKAFLPPCCRDSIGTVACQRLKAGRASWFTTSCNTKADFRLIQCCQTCEADGSVYKYNTIARTLTQAACFDRMSPAYCAKFVYSLAPWTSATWTCDGKYSAVAFRICRLSCGYCSLNTTGIAATLTEANFNYERAMEQCSGLGNNNDDPDAAFYINDLP